MFEKGNTLALNKKTPAELLMERRHMVILVAEGMPRAKVAEMFGVEYSVLIRALKENKELASEIHESVKAMAIFERGNNLNTLIEIRDKSPNDMARAKAIEMLEARAGVLPQVDPSTKANVVVIVGSELNIATTTNEDIERVVGAMRALLPEARKVIDAELVVERRGHPSRSDAAGPPGENPEGGPKDAGGAVGEASGGTEKTPEGQPT